MTPGDPRETVYAYAELDVPTGIWLIDIPQRHIYSARSHAKTIRGAVAEILPEAPDDYALVALTFDGEDELQSGR